MEVAGPSLVLYLEISWCINSTEICNLTNLDRFEYWAFGTNLRLKNVSQLVELSIAGWVIQGYMPDFLPKFSSCFSQPETLELDVDQAEEFGGFHHAPVPEFPNLRKLVLKSKSIGSYDKCLMGYTSWIKVSPLFQKFVLLVFSSLIILLYYSNHLLLLIDKMKFVACRNIGINRGSTITGE